MIIVPQERALALVMRHGKLQLHCIGDRSRSIQTFAPFMSGFWLVDRKMPSKVKFTKLTPAFDIRKLEKLSESGYLLAQHKFMGRGIKKIKVFESVNGKSYLFLATFMFKQAEAAENKDKYSSEQFPPAARAPTYQYQLDCFALP